MDNIVIIGSSGHAKVVIDIVEKEGRYNIAGLIDQGRKVGEYTLDYRILGRIEDLPQLVKSHSLGGAIVAIGENYTRSKVVNCLREICTELQFVSTIHPKATMASDVLVGDGTVIMAGVTVNPCCSIGQFCILNTNSSLDHDSVVKDFASIAPGVSTGGGCKIGSFSAIGIGAVLVHGVNIGEHTVIGAGSTVLGNISTLSVAFGTPAKTVRSRKPGDKYL